MLLLLNVTHMCANARGSLLRRDKHLVCARGETPACTGACGAGTGETELLVAHVLSLTQNELPSLKHKRREKKYLLAIGGSGAGCGGASDPSPAEAAAKCL